MLSRRTYNCNIECYTLMREREREKRREGKKGKEGKERGKEQGRKTDKEEGRQEEGRKKMDYLETLGRSECRHYNADIMIEKLICI